MSPERRAKELWWRRRPRRVPHGCGDESIAPALQVSEVALETMYTGWGDPPDAALPCYTSPKLSETTNLKVNTLDSETGSFDLAGSGMKAISYGRTSSVVKTTYTGSEDPPSAAPSCYTCSKFGETANVKANTFDVDTGNFELTGSGLESISCSGNEAPPSAAPSDYTGPKLRETVIVTVNTFASEAGSLGLTGSGLESETVNLKVNTIVSDTGSFDLMGSGLESDTVNLEVNTLASETGSFKLTGSGLESLGREMKTLSVPLLQIT